MVEDEIRFRGHPNVLSLHSRTLEITKHDHLSLRGDCIIGVNASKACADLNESVRNGVQNSDSIVRIEVFVGSESYSIQGLGNSKLNLLDKNDIVIRKTEFTCPRTLSVKCDKASVDLPRTMVKSLQDSATTGILRVSVE
jgi:hypothetical protein